MKIIRWTAVVLMGALALYELLILAFITFATLSPKPSGLPLAWIFTIGELSAVVLALRYGWLPMVAGVLQWIMDVVVFQFGEQHVNLITAIQHSSLDFAFIFLALVCWLVPRTPRSARIAEPKRSQRT